MNCLTQAVKLPAARAETRKPKNEKRPLAAQLLRALHAEWRKLSPNLDSDLPERELRLAWTNETFGRGGAPSPPRAGAGARPYIASWSDLTTGQAKYLLKKMRAELGESPLNDYIARAAVRLWGPNWNDALADRIGQRFKRGPEIAALEFWMKKSLFEELVGRIARQELGIRIQDSGEHPNPKHLAPTPGQTEMVRMEIVRGKIVSNV